VVVDEAPRNIRFACTCHAVLEVSIEQAGMSIQCPCCGRLVDVPTLSDLQTIDEDGLYRMGELELQEEPDRLAKLHRAFWRNRTDEQGNEIDLRENFQEEIPVAEPIETLEEANPLDAAIGDPVIAAEEEAIDVLAKDAFEKPPPPRYDPITGELLRPLPLQEEPVHFDPATVPMAQAVINYAGTATYIEVYNTSTAVASSLNPSVVGQSVTYTANVTGIVGSGQDPLPNGPTGTVTFKDGATTICSNVAVTVGATTSTASCTPAPAYSSPISHAITATYTNSDGNFTGSNGALTGYAGGLTKKRAFLALEERS